MAVTPARARRRTPRVVREELLGEQSAQRLLLPREGRDDVEHVGWLGPARARDDELVLGAAVQDEALAVLVTPFDDLGREVFAEAGRRARVVADAPVLGVAELVPQLVDRRLRRDAGHVVAADLAVVLVAVELEVADVREPGRQRPTVDAVVGQVFADVVDVVRSRPRRRRAGRCSSRGCRSIPRARRTCRPGCAACPCR